MESFDIRMDENGKKNPHATQELSLKSVLLAKSDNKSATQLNYCKLTVHVSYFATYHLTITGHSITLFEIWQKCDFLSPPDSIFFYFHVPNRLKSFF